MTTTPKPFFAQELMDAAESASDITRTATLLASLKRLLEEGGATSFRVDTPYETSLGEIEASMSTLCKLGTYFTNCILQQAHLMTEHYKLRSTQACKEN